MKKLLFIFCLLISSMSFAQDSTIADILKDDMPEVYESIVTFSTNKWNKDPALVEQEVNNQSVAFFTVSKILNENEEDKELIGWVMDAVENNSNGVVNGDISTNPTVDWQAVIEEVMTKL